MLIFCDMNCIFAAIQLHFFKQDPKCISDIRISPHGRCFGHLVCRLSEVPEVFTYLLPGQPHSLKTLLSIFCAVRAEKLKEVVSFQVAGLLPTKLS